MIRANERAEAQRIQLRCDCCLAGSAADAVITPE